MTRLRSTGALVAITAALALGCAQAASARMTGAHIRAQLNQLVSTLRGMGVPGGVIGVTGGPVGRYSAAFGIAAPGRPMTQSTHFRIGSVTKTFTATVILKLVDLGRLRLDESIAKWEPKIPNAKRITIRMLLGMTSGIWDEGGTGPTGRVSLLGKWIGRHCRPKNPLPDCGKFWRPQQLVDLAIREGAPAYPPGIFYYSDTNYMILGIIAQKVMHTNLGSLVQRFILRPLHMRQTSMPTLTMKVPAPAAVGYMGLPLPPKLPTRYAVSPSPSPSAFFGAGNIVSTLGDLQIWAKALGTGALLKPATQRMRLEVVPTGGAVYPFPGIRSSLPLSYGLGVATFGSLIGHNGELSPPGFTAEDLYAPSVKGTLVVLLNSATQCNGGLMSDGVAGTVAQLAFGRVGSGAASAPGFLGIGCPVVAR